MEPIPATEHSPNHNQRLRFHAAFEQLQTEIKAVDTDELIPINLDIPAIAMQVLGVAPTILSHEAEIKDQLPKFKMENVAKIASYAMAAWYCHTQYQAASAPVEPIQDMTDALTKSREVLVSDVTALAVRNLLDGSRLKELQGPVGYKNLVNDVMLLTNLMRDNWHKIDGKTGVSPQELDNAEDLADRLATAVGLRDQGPNVASASSEMRQKAFTLFVNSYDAVRRAISYLRWEEGDLETIAPSLYGGRTGSSKKKPGPTATPGAPAAGATGTPATGPIAPTNPIAPINGIVAPRVPDAPPVAVAPGLPGNPPFNR